MEIDKCTKCKNMLIGGGRNELSLPKNYILNPIDWARIIGIYLVVLGHMQYCGLNINIKNCIYLFHMPLFFVISGMLHKNSFKKSINSFCGMIFLFVLFNAPFIILYSLRHNTIELSTITGNIPTWFFLTLGIIKLLCYKITKISAILYTLISVFAIQCIHSFNIDISPYLYVKSIFMALPFFLLGYYVKGFLLKRHNIILPLLCIGILIGATIVYGRVDIFQGTFKYTYMDYFIVAICGVFIITEISNRLPLISSRTLWTISRGTAIIVGCHYYLCEKTSIIYIHNFILPFVFSVVIILLLYPIVSFATNKFPFFIGKLKLV